MQVGIHEIEQYKESYFEYIKRNETKFGIVLDTFDFKYMLKERLLSKEIEYNIVRKSE